MVWQHYFSFLLLLYLADHIRPIPPKGLWSTQRFVILGATVLAAVITPTPDALNMMIVAVPIIAVYEPSAIAVVAKHRLATRRAKAIREVAVETQSDPLDLVIADMQGVMARRVMVLPKKHAKRYMSKPDRLSMVS